MKDFFTKKNVTKIILVAICLFVLSYKFGNWKFKNTTSMEDFYAQVLEDNMDFKSHGYYIVDFEPDGIDYFDMQDNVLAKDPYRGSNFYGFSCSYKEKDGRFYVTLKYEYYVNKFKFFMADLRINQIYHKIKHLSDYEKIKATHDYIIRYCEYSMAGEGAYDTLYKGFAACNGYALSFYRIMQKCDIPVTFETGDHHGWNLVQLDGKWYNIDLTWDDGGGKDVKYDYFLKCDADFEGHEHGGSDADTSVEITGKSAQEYYKMFPPYQLIFLFLALIVLFVVAAIVIGIWYICFLNKKRKKKEKQDLEVKIMLNDNYTQLDEELVDIGDPTSIKGKEESDMVLENETVDLNSDIKPNAEVDEQKELNSEGFGSSGFKLKKD